MTREQAIALAESKFWEPLNYTERATFQLYEPLMCMPFAIFHEAVEKALGRPVWTHEFALNLDGIKAELRGDKEHPTMQEIIELIPAEKRILCAIDSSEAIHFRSDRP